MASGEIEVDAGRTRGEVQIVRTMFEAFARRDVEGALEHVDERVQFSAQGTATLAGRTGPYRGHEGLRQYFADVEAFWEELSVSAHDYRAVSGAVVVFGHVHGRRHGGETLNTAAIWTWRVERGRVISGSVFPTPDAAGGQPPSA